LKFSKAIVAKLDELDFVSFADPRPRSIEEENWYKLAFEEAFYCSIINCFLENELLLLSNIKDITEGKLDSDDALFERFDLGLSSKMH